jgi:hypothetical protein
MKPPMEHKPNCAAIRTRRPWECDCLPDGADPKAEPFYTMAERDAFDQGYQHGWQIGNERATEPMAYTPPEPASPQYEAAAMVSIALALILIALW